MDHLASCINEKLASLVKYNILEAFGSAGTSALALQLARQTLGWADTLIDRYEAENPLPHPLACLPACDFCCHNQVEVTPLEAFAIWGYVQDCPPEKKTRWQEKVTSLAIKKAGMTKEEIARARREFPCPFLENSLCAVYPVRPLLCRAMHSLDAGHCQQSLLAENLIPDQYYLHRHEIAFSIIKGVTDACQDAGCQANSQDLALAMQAFFLAPEGIVQAWLQGEKVFPGPGSWRQTRVAS